jgi:Carboxypeptidase regulatory-like domain
MLNPGHSLKADSVAGGRKGKDVIIMAARAAGVASRFALLLVVIMYSFSVAITQESCVVSGRVIDEKGKPIPFAALSALRGQSTGVGGEPLLAVNGATADHRGEYCIRGLPPGEYLIRATTRTQPPSASPDCNACCGPNSELAAMFHRRSRSREHATRVPVRNGRNASGVDIMMRRVPAYCVRGEVRDHRGALLSDAAIALEADSWSAGVLSEGGRFLLTHLPSGSYTVVVRDRPQVGCVLVRRVIHVGAANIAGLVITVPSGLRCKEHFRSWTPPPTQLNLLRSGTPASARPPWHRQPGRRVI